MTSASLLPIFAILVMFLFEPTNAQTWRGNYQSVRRIEWRRTSYCICWYRWWGCSYWRYYSRAVYVTVKQCRTGWGHNGDRNCNIPICRPSCQNNGRCIAPNTCDCGTTASGPTCGNLICSYKRPCYPGDCGAEGLANTCKCDEGFLYHNATTGCIKFDPGVEKLRPVVGKSNITLSNIRRVDKYTNYMFILESTGDSSDEFEIVWSNQKRFNDLLFDVEVYFEPIQTMPERPAYVHDTKIGIVEAKITANVSKIPRQAGPIRDEAFFETYPCQFNQDNPETDVASCSIEDDQFSTLIEHGDWLHVNVLAKSGGYQKLFNTDRATYGNKHYYQGLQDIRSVRFLFDFIAPKHCSQPGAYAPCPPNDVILEVEEEFTKDPIRPRWLGWTDDLSGVWEYYVEVFKLGPDAYEMLVETDPLKPVFTITPTHSENIDYPEFRPNESGMYSVLVETRDIANNSRISRRLVLYDNTSEITLNTAEDGALYVSSAEAETGYTWQTASDGDSVRIELRWDNHFRNLFHEENKLLYEVKPYPVQFKDIEDDGLLSVKKYVAEDLDDNEGQRTIRSIRNFHGIVKFEVAQVYTQDEDEPTKGWEVIPLAEDYATELKLGNGQSVRMWVRATDVMGNTKADSHVLTIDNTPPTVASADEITFTKNVLGGAYNYSSRVEFKSADGESGVYKFGVKIIADTPKQRGKILYEGFEPANVAGKDAKFCTVIGDKCFYTDQELNIDNCWFLVNREELESSTGAIELTAYNQAMLTDNTTFNIGKISSLEGLEKYDGPSNFRTESSNPNGFRLTWDLPQHPSCYGRATIVITLILGKNPDGSLLTRTFYVDGNSRYYDILGLEPNTEYSLEFGLQTTNSSATVGEGISLAVRTEERIAVTGASGGAIAGVAVAVLAIVAIAIAVFAILVRRGVLSPPVEQVRKFGRSVRHRTQMLYGGQTTSTDDDDLYIYGGMDMTQEHTWDIDRNDITFEALIKTGNFANIYLAYLRKPHGPPVKVVAKTLKENYTPDDELLMKAKINFTGKEVGSHPNILQFMGAVLTDPALGPFIIYEFCENGTLKEYLTRNKSNITIEVSENLYKFGLDIAKGMEYLAGKGIVHRRLAARNILLSFVNEVKISGFGPQPVKGEDDAADAETGKKERIPIKWMAPECMESTKGATEKSDVWSYAVVLWEIFSLGEAPYTGKGRDLPQRLKKGERLEKPEQCDDVWYALMRKCWEYKPSRRPKFADVRKELDTMFVAAPGDDYYYRP